jgi:hypothetical protein
MCQFLAQKERIEAWIQSVLCQHNTLRSSITGYFTDRKKGEGRNIHSLHLLSFMRNPHKDAKEIQEIKEPSYSYMKRDISVSEEQLLLQQCMQGNELDWASLSKKWNIFPYSLEFLMNLLRVYPQPLKLLMMISHTSLYNIFETATMDRFGDVLLKLEGLLKDEVFNAFGNMVKHIDKEPSIFSYIAVLKWSLLSNGNTKERLPFDGRDMQVIIDSHIPITIRNESNNGDMIIPIMLGLDGPPGI